MPAGGTLSRRIPEQIAADIEKETGVPVWFERRTIFLHQRTRGVYHVGVRRPEWSDLKCVSAASALRESRWIRDGKLA